MVYVDNGHGPPIGVASFPGTVSIVGAIVTHRGHRRLTDGSAMEKSWSQRWKKDANKKRAFIYEVRSAK